MKIVVKNNRASLVVGNVRCAVEIVTGPWIAGVNPELIKLRAKKPFPAAIREALTVENNSDMREDYFESDCIRLVPGHCLYAAVKAVA